METKTTTIKLSTETKKRLDSFKRYKRESYDEIVQHVLALLVLCKAAPERARARLIALDKSKKRGDFGMEGEEE